jgi:hypothetical protein
LGVGSRSKKWHAKKRAERRRKQHPPSPRQPEEPDNRAPPSRWRRIVVGVLSTGIALGGYIALRPRVDFTPLDPVYNNKPSDVPFQIKNSSYYSLKNVDAHCVVNHTKGERAGLENLVIDDNQWHVDELRSNDVKTIVCQLSLDPGIVLDEAEVSIVVTSTAFLLPSQQSATYVGQRGNPSWRWLQQPTADFDLKKLIHVHNHRMSWPNHAANTSPGATPATVAPTPSP